MKNIITICLLFIFGLSTSMEAQSPKRYMFLQHFTNTVCSICAVKNPPFFATLAQYPEDMHHVSIHPPVPYSTCEFYLENESVNEYFTNQYGINGTPKMYLWGGSVSSSQLLSETVIQDALGQTSPIHVGVEESGTNTRDVTVTITAHEDVPDLNDYRLFIVAVEKNVSYDAPNGESDHHNVLRTMMVPPGGIVLQSLNAGEVFTLPASFSVDPNWVESEMYTIAYVQNLDNREVMNSGTKFDAPIVSSTNEKWSDVAVNIYPNPVTTQFNIEVADQQINAVQLYDIKGKLVQFKTSNINTTVDISRLKTGVYFVRIELEDGISIQKITKL